MCFLGQLQLKIGAKIKKITENCIFFQKYLVISKKSSTFALAFEKEVDIQQMVRQFSWLEYMPVTHGVASSSLVRTAKKQSKRVASFFCKIYRILRTIHALFTHYSRTIHALFTDNKRTISTQFPAFKEDLIKTEKGLHYSCKGFLRIVTF